MKAIAAEPDAAAAAALPAVSFADAYRIVCIAPGLDARRAAEVVFAAPPAWVNSLMALRNCIVALFGLKHDEAAFAGSGQARVGMFPVIAESARQIVLGLDDRHLDFRISVTLCDEPDGATGVNVTTAVLTHNWLGRSYLAVILPFHRLIARHMLSRARF